MSELKDLTGPERQARALEWLEEAERQYKQEENNEAAIAAALLGLGFMFLDSYAYYGGG